MAGEALMMDYLRREGPKIKSRLSTAAKIGVGLALGLGTYIVGKKIYDDIRERNTENKLGEDPNVDLAVLLKQGVNPSGFDYMISFDGTDETVIFQAAARITDLNKVAAAYSKMYQRSLVKDLQNELSASDFAKFQSLLGTASGAGTSTGGATTTTADTSFANLTKIAGAHVYPIGRRLIARLDNTAIYDSPTSTRKVILRQKANNSVGTVVVRVFDYKVTGSKITDIKHWYKINAIPGQDPNRIGYVFQADIRG